MADYVRALQGDDFPNAIAIWDYLAEQHYAHLISTSDRVLNASLPPIFSSFMPKSGGTYLFNRMTKELGYHHFFWGITRNGSLSEFYPVSSAIEIYRRGGMFCHTHCLPTPYFRMIMERHEVWPIWVHARHPAEVCYAGYFHYQGLGQGHGEIREKRLSDMKAEIEMLRSKHGFTLRCWPSFFTEWVGYYAGWLAQWLSYAKCNPGAVFFTYYDQITDVNALVGQVMRHYGCDPSVEISDHELSDDRRRSDGGHDWASGLSSQQIASQQHHIDVWGELMKFRYEANTVPGKKI